MSGGDQNSLFFLRLPDLKKLCYVTVSLQDQDEDLRSKQIKTCRELVLLFSDLLASPALDSFSEVTVVMAVTFFRKGILQAFGQRRHLQLDRPQCVLPGILQCCLSYSLITRLSPSWNKAGLYLISGNNFLTDSGTLSAVSTELSCSDRQLCVSVKAHALRLPPTTLEDFDFAPLVLRNFWSDLDSVLHIGGAVWCHVLPSMKKGQIITVSRQLPTDSPFRTYRDLQNHWNRLYGYRLPELAAEDEVYCSVYFRLLGDRLFTYPLSCVRLQPVQRCARLDLQGVLCSFLSDIRCRVQNVCGFPSSVTSKPAYDTAGLSSAASVQVLNGDPVSLTASSSSRLVLSQLPVPAPRPPRPWFGSQPLVLPRGSRQSGPSVPLRHGCEMERSLAQKPGSRGDGDWPSASSSSSSQVYRASPLSFANPLGPSATSFSSSSSSSGFRSAASLPLRQPATSLTSSVSSSCVSFSLPPLSQPGVKPAPKLVPLFKNKRPSLRADAALLRIQRQKEQRIGGEEPGRVTLPAGGKNKPAPSFLTSSSSSVPQGPPICSPPTIPRFSLQPAAPQPDPKHRPSPSPLSRPKPGMDPNPRPDIKPQSKAHLKTKTNPHPRLGQKTVNFSDKVQKAPKHPSPPEPRRHPAASEVCSKGSSSTSRQQTLTSKSRKSRSASQSVDVETMVRNNQLSKLNSASLLAWLKGRGVSIGAKHRKEELLLKVMACLAEA